MNSSNFFDVIVSACGHIYNFFMGLVAPLQAPIKDFSTTTLTYFNPFFNENYTTVSFSNVPMLGNAIDYIEDVVAKLLQIFEPITNISEDTETWVVMLFLVVCFSIPILIWRTVSNALN